MLHLDFGDVEREIILANSGSLQVGLQGLTPRRAGVLEPEEMDLDLDNVSGPIVLYLVLAPIVHGLLGSVNLLIIHHDYTTSIDGVVVDHKVVAGQGYTAAVAGTNFANWVEGPEHQPCVRSISHVVTYLGTFDKLRYYRVDWRGRKGR